MVAVLVTIVGGGCATRMSVPLPDAPAPRETPSRAQTVVHDELPCVQAPRIDRWEHKLRNDPAFRNTTADSLARGAELLPRIRETFVAAGLPPGLALLPVVESGFRPQVKEHGGIARGLWQLEPATARSVGLVVNARRDDRIHPERATVAAARLLARLHARYGDWPLALAAYNAGAQRVDRARARRPEADFWELAELGLLPRTSRDFVSRFFATVRVTEGVTICRAV